MDINIFTRFFLYLIALIFSSCVRDFNDDCPADATFILLFEYKDRAGNDIFNERVQRVDVFVYDSDNLLIQRQTINEEQLTAFAGTELTDLCPSRYRIVVWGNMSDKHSFSGVHLGSLFSEARLSHVSENGGEPLLYAPATPLNATASAFIIHVSGTETRSATISFSRAHKRIEVYVIGFENRAETLGELPIIRLEGVSAHYGFDRAASENRIVFQSDAVARTQGNRQVAFAGFYTPLFGQNNPKVIHVKSANNNVVYSVNLRDFLANNAEIVLHDTDIPDMVIPVLISFNKDLSVDISVPNWEENVVRPEY